MFKWVRAKLDSSSVDHAGRVDANAPVRSDAQPTSMISAAAQRVTRRLVAISSSGFDSPTADDILRALERVPSPKIARRPGVHARWKEANRVPYQHTL
ncbi:MAG: hypothetical protein ABL931_11495 [Usitatibacteraceae bacterium]